jgi:hypothetical protein
MRSATISPNSCDTLVLRSAAWILIQSAASSDSLIVTFFTDE